MTILRGDWLDRPETRAVCRVFDEIGAQILFVGGCVRNTLLQMPVGDIDMATDLGPDRVSDLVTAAGLKAIPTGYDHGTVTVVSGGIPHEITTFRRDVETDGRRAVVAFSDNVADDAARRDFTMNALYARPDGTLVDPLDGLADLRARRVRFIGDAGQRIREDYLRSLRYFRFHAWYGDQRAGLDMVALAAIAGHLDGLETLSRERVGAELTRLLAAPDPVPSVAGMRSAGVLGAILPGADDTALGPLVHFEDDLSLAPDPIRRLAALGGDFETLRLSRSDLRRVDMLRRLASEDHRPGRLGHLHGAETGLDALLLRCAFLGRPVDPADVAQVGQGAGAVFPVTSRDLMPRLQGAALGAALAQLRETWIASDFTLDRDALLRLGR